MPYRKRQFANSQIYHVVMRGIDENLIFKNLDDYYRGIFSIYEFNTTKPVVIRDRRKARAYIKKLLEQKKKNSVSVVDLRDKLVEVLAFCLMPNHLHLLLRQLKDNGVTKFMTKVGTGYGGYFNRKYSRKGYVFQNRFVTVHVKNDEQLRIVFAYIHTNPISLVEPKWKEKGIHNFQKVIEYLKIYRWSSYSDYIGVKNFPSVTDRRFILETMGGEEACKEFIENWIKYKGKIREFAELALE